MLNRALNWMKRQVSISYRCSKMLVLALLAICMVNSILQAETFPVPVGDFAPRSYIAMRPIDEIVIDGEFSEASWQAAALTEDFVDIEGDLKPLPYYRTRVKMLWDEEFIYFAAVLEEPHIWAKLTQRDAVIFHDNDFEIFLDPNGDTHDYYELELNALGTLWDLLIIKPYRDRNQVAVNAWDIRTIDYAIGIDGSLNDPSDTDSLWCVELKLPLAVISELANMPIPPRDGDFWRLNFSRVQWETQIVEGDYVKIPGKPEYNWVWSPQGLIAMHYPERWGYLFFSNLPVGSLATPGTYQIPASEEIKEALRQIYYLQKQYFMDHGHYARSLRSLGAKPLYWNGKRLRLRYERYSTGYLITSPAAPGLPSYHIREDGLIW